MLISTLIVFDQLKFLRNKDLGFNKENVVRLNLSTREMRKKDQALADQLRTLPEVVAVGKADASPGSGIGKLLFKVEDAEGKMVDRGVDLYSADHDYLETMGMKVTRGRNFSKDNPGDTLHAVLVNESMVARMGWKDPLGKRFQGGGNEKKVVGVVKDYNQNSLYDAIEPLIIVLGKDLGYVFVRLKPGDVKAAMGAVEKVWKEVLPGNTLDYTFLDQDLDSQYKADQKRSQIFTAFSALTIIIACLGLLGLAAFSTEQRTQEIGIRKVIGASVQGLAFLVSKEFFIWVGIGMILAIPAAWYFTDRWLQNFAYRIDLKDQWPTFLLSAAIAFLITLITVGYHVLRAAWANPVESLRTE
jgi:putative ABC transport system permease protein